MIHCPTSKVCVCFAKFRKQYEVSHIGSEHGLLPGTLILAITKTFCFRNDSHHPENIMGMPRAASINVFFLLVLNAQELCSDDAH